MPSTSCVARSVIAAAASVIGLPARAMPTPTAPPTRIARRLWGSVRARRTPCCCTAGLAAKQMTSLAALGLEMRDLYPQQPDRNGDKPMKEDLGAPLGKAYPYRVRDGEGTVLALHWRKDFECGKRMWWSHPDGKTNELPPGLKPEDMLYGLQELARNPDLPFALVEGEKAADALIKARLRMVVLATVTGAAGTPSRVALEHLKGRRGAVWADADSDPMKGRAHMDRTAALLAEIGVGELRNVIWPEAPEGGDAADYMASHGREDVLTLLRGAPAWQPTKVHEPREPREPLRTQDSSKGRNPAEIAALDETLRPLSAGLDVGVMLSDVKPERIEWFWYGRLARGKVTIMDGDPGQGKSVLSVDIAARISTGSPWPDGTPCPRGGVVLLSAEDGLADTIRPRLDAAGGEPSQVLFLDSVDRVDDDGQIHREPVMLPEDLGWAEAAIQRVKAIVVIVDPLMAFLSGRVNSHRDQDVRPAPAEGAG